MTSLFQYTLSVSIPLFILWVIYKWALASEKQFEANRFVLLCIYITSLALPPAINLYSQWTAHDGSTAIPTIALSGSPALLQHLPIIAMIWLIGATVATVVTILEITRVSRTISGCRRVELDGKTIYLSKEKGLSPFSIGGMIVMNETDYRDSRETILNHEYGHIMHRHSADMILAQAVAILCWYNPAAWLMRSELKSVHEYQADNYTLIQGCDARSYQLFLIKKAAGSKFPSIANNLNHSKLRKRIAMMNRTADWRAWRKSLYALPLAGVLLGITTLNNPEVKSILTPATPTTATTTATEKEQRLSPIDDAKIYIDGTEMDRNDLNNVAPSEIKSITISKDRNRIDIHTNE